MKCIFFLFILLLISSSSFGQKGVHQHDGFFLRMLGGIGYAELVEKDGLDSDIKFSGAASSARFQIGGTVSYNLIIYGEFGGVMQTDPKMEWMGQTATATNLSASAFDFGGGVTYYFMPVNVYFSVSLHGSRAELKYNNIKAESEFGFGFNAMFGKEWWIADDWALGAAIYGYYSTMKDKGSIGYTINNFSVGVLFSATYN
jgi:hypothetical protein